MWGEKKLMNQNFTVRFSKKVIDSIKINLVRFDKRKWKVIIVNHLIAPKRKGINAFNLFSAFYTGKYLLGEDLSVLIYLWLKCLFSEPKHLQFQLGGVRHLFTFICLLILILLPVLLSPIPFHLSSCYKPFKDPF